MQSNENLSPAVAARIMKEIRTMMTSPPEGIRVSLLEDNITQILGEIEGPVGTPFEGGLFKCKLVLGQDFPQHPPKGAAARCRVSGFFQFVRFLPCAAVFLTKLFHPNVSKIGEICVNTLKKDWKPSHGIAHVLMVRSISLSSCPLLAAPHALLPHGWC
jgi:ubiquitin-conjugating enzyme E2 S